MTVFGIRVFVDVIMVKFEMKLYRLMVGPKSKEWCPWKKRGEDTETERRGIALVNTYGGWS